MDARSDLRGDAAPDGPRVPEHPARKEGVFVQLSCKEGDLLVMSHFDRDKDGKPVRPSEVRANWQPTAAAPVGNFAGLFA